VEEKKEEGIGDHPCGEQREQAVRGVYEDHLAGKKVPEIEPIAVGESYLYSRRGTYIRRGREKAGDRLQPGLNRWVHNDTSSSPRRKKTEGKKEQG